MTKRKGERRPRPPVPGNLPATFAEAEEAEIITALERWFIHIADKLNSEAAHEMIRDNMLGQLERGEDASLPVTYIVAMAEAEHASADHALRIHIHAAIDADRFNDLPLQIRNYAMRALRGPPLPIGYPSDRSQVVNDFTRDLIIARLVDEIVVRWQRVPKLYSSLSRHSAAWLLAQVCIRRGIKLTERQVRRIYNARNTIHRRLAEFLIADLPFE